MFRYGKTNKKKVNCSHNGGKSPLSVYSFEPTWSRRRFSRVCNRDLVLGFCDTGRCFSVWSPSSVKTFKVSSVQPTQIVGCSTLKSFRVKRKYFQTSNFFLFFSLHNITSIAQCLKYTALLLYCCDTFIIFAFSAQFARFCLLHSLALYPQAILNWCQSSGKSTRECFAGCWEMFSLHLRCRAHDCQKKKKMGWA